MDSFFPIVDRHLRLENQTSVIHLVPRCFQKEFVFLGCMALRQGKRMKLLVKKTNSIATTVISFT